MTPEGKAVFKALLLSAGLSAGVGLGVYWAEKKGYAKTPSPRFPWDAANRIYDSVRDAFKAFSAPLEGYLPYMYLDSLGLVTTGMGNLLDTRPHSAYATPAALRLPWKLANGNRASAADIQEAWRTVSSRADLAKLGGGHFAGLTKIHLDRPDIEALVWEHFGGDEANLKKIFPAYTTWPADAQLALHGMAWALGSNFPLTGQWPKFMAAARQNPPDFATMARESQAPTIAPKRNLQTAQMFRNAAAVSASSLDPKEVHFPIALA